MRKVQARTLATRDRLLAAGREIVAAQGLAGLRTDEVVLRAGTAKGTFFAHFADRDHFLAALLAERLTVEFAGLEAAKDRKGLEADLDRVFAAFAAADFQQMACAVDVADGEGNGFSQAQAAGINDFEA